ncbi:MAG: YdjY domain-containing protein [Gemmataceae bacterium]|nr:YdjY domain-containing protein [Gemmataceae bacterium]
MRKWIPIAGIVIAISGLRSGAYVEVPYSMGRVLAESTNVVLIEVQQVNKERNLIIYKKLKDLKGQHPEQIIKHNIGKNGFHPREWQYVMAWAEPGKRAVFFHNGGASETCIGTYWYQAYKGGDWWAMSHGEPYLLRTYCGDVDRLAEAVSAMLQGKEVALPCMVDGNREQIQLRKGKMQILRASLKIQDYNPKRDFLGFGADLVDIPQFKTIVVLEESSGGWKFLPAAKVQSQGTGWTAWDYDDSAWQRGKAPIGYGEEEIAKRRGTTIDLKGRSMVFRREFLVSADLLQQKDVTFRVGVASDDSAVVYLNGTVIDQDPEADHEFAYWNREIELKPQQLRAGRNVIAALVRNAPQSSDLYFDMEVAALIPIPKKVAKGGPPIAAKTGPGKTPALPEEKLPPELVIDRQRRMVSLPCTVAPRKLPHLKDIYPIEVVATLPHPQGQKAHETIVNFQGIRPSMVHRALLELNLKPGAPARGEDAKPTGPEVEVYFETVGPMPQRWPIDGVLLDTRTGKPPPPLTWRFTGSAFRQPDPEKDEFVYGANVTGTLITIFPVTDETVIQAEVSLANEGVWRLEVNPKVLPKEGASGRLVIRAK